MDDLSETAGTYEAVAGEYRRRHDDRSVIADQRERFLDALVPAPDRESGGERPDPGRPRVLDAGCGPGWESAAFDDRGCSVLAIDLAPSFLAATDDRAAGVGAARMDMRRLGVESDALDGIWACASFLHVPRADAPGTLAEFARALRPGGVLHLTVKHGSGEYTADSYEGDDRRFVLYEPGGIRGLVEDAGFAVEHFQVDPGDPEGWIVVLARLRDSPGPDDGGS